MCSSDLIALSLSEEDELVGVHQTNSRDAILVATKNGQGIMFDATDVRPMGRTARGVRAINLNEGDEVVGATVPKEGQQILTTTEKGLGKRTQTDAFRAQKRGGKGLRINKITEKTGCIVGIASVSDDEELLLITSEGVIIRIKVSQISSIGRNAQGVKLINVADDVHVVCMEKVNEAFIDDSVELAEITEGDNDFIEDDVDEQEEDSEE